MKILAIESSCDETAGAVVEKKEDGSIHVLSNVLATSLSLHAKTGGIIPEQAAREQIKYILPVMKQTLREAKLTSDLQPLTSPPVDAIAVTYGPGLIGSLLVGVETAKTLSYVWNIPIVPVNHLLGHIAANCIVTSNEKLLTINKSDVSIQKLAIAFPAIALIASGAHTDLLYMKTFKQYTWLGGTRDDAAGEAFDKIGRMLGFPYPAGPMIERLATEGNPKAYHFPRPMIGSHDFDFSFSGLKTAALREVQKETMNDEPSTINNLCASVQQAIIDVLVKKTLKASEKYTVGSILLGGGVAANQTFITKLKQSAISHKLSAKILAPPKFLCTDNAAMIGATALLNYKPIPWTDITADPQLHF